MSEFDENNILNEEPWEEEEQYYGCSENLTCPDGLSCPSGHQFSYEAGCLYAPIPEYTVDFTELTANFDGEYSFQITYPANTQPSFPAPCYQPGRVDTFKGWRNTAEAYGDIIHFPGTRIELPQGWSSASFQAVYYETTFTVDIDPDYTEQIRPIGTFPYNESLYADQNIALQDAFPTTYTDADTRDVNINYTVNYRVNGSIISSQNVGAIRHEAHGYFTDHYTLSWPIEGGEETHVYTPEERIYIPYANQDDLTAKCWIYPSTASSSEYITTGYTDNGHTIIAPPTNYVSWIDEYGNIYHAGDIFYNLRAGHNEWSDVINLDAVFAESNINILIADGDEAVETVSPASVALIPVGTPQANSVFVNATLHENSSTETEETSSYMSRSYTYWQIDGLRYSFNEWRGNTVLENVLIIDDRNSLNPTIAINNIVTDGKLYASGIKQTTTTYKNSIVFDQNYDTIPRTRRVYTRTEKEHFYDPVLFYKDDVPSTEREGYKFIKWNTQANGLGEDYYFGMDQNIDTNLTLYAQWEQLSYVEFIYNENHMSLIEPHVASGTKVYCEHNLAYPLQGELKPNQVGTWSNASQSIYSYQQRNTTTFNFINWVMACINGIILEPSSLNTQLYINTYTGDGVVTAETEQLDYTEYRNIIILHYNYPDRPDQTLTIYTNPTNEYNGYKDVSFIGTQSPYEVQGFVHTGWTENSDGTGTFYPFTNAQFNNNIELYGKWEPSATVTYSHNNYIYTTNPSGEHQYIVGNTITFEAILKTPISSAWQDLANYSWQTYYEYSFVRWDIENLPGSFTGDPLSRISSYQIDAATLNGTIQAIGEETSTTRYKNIITYNRNLTIDDTTTITDETSINTDLNTPRTFHTFNTPIGWYQDDRVLICWNTERDGSGTRYDLGADCTTTNNILLYAQWDSIARIQFHKNNHIEEMWPPQETIDDYPLNVPIDIRASVYEDGYGEEWEDKTQDGYAYQQGTLYDYSFDEWTKTDTTYGTFADSHSSTTTFTPTAVTYNGEITANGKVETSNAYRNKITYYSNTIGEQMSVGFTAQERTHDASKSFNAAGAIFTDPLMILLRWNTERDDTGTPYELLQPYEINNNLVLYGIWQDSSTVAITHDEYVKSTTPTGFYQFPLNNEVELRAVMNDPSYSAGVAESSGGYYYFHSNETLYQFLNWTKSEGLSGDFGSATSATTTFTLRALSENGRIMANGTASVTDVYYNEIVLNGNGGFYNENSTYKLNTQIASTFAEYKPIILFNRFTNEGKSFRCWSTNQDGTGDIYYDLDTSYFNTNTTLYAQWEDSTAIQLTYNSNTIAEVEPALAMTVALNVPMSINAILKSPEIVYTPQTTSGLNYYSVTETNYVFDSWSNVSAIGELSNSLFANALFTPTAKTVLNGELYADATADISNYYCNSITYYANNGGMLDPVVIYTANKETYDEYTNIYYEGEIFSADRKVLIGWNTAADRSGTHYDLNTHDTINTNMVLYGEWASGTKLYIEHDEGIKQIKPGSPIAVLWNEPTAIKAVLKEYTVQHYKPRMVNGYLYFEAQNTHCEFVNWTCDAGTTGTFEDETALSTTFTLTVNEYENTIRANTVSTVTTQYFNAVTYYGNGGITQQNTREYTLYASSWEAYNADKIFTTVNKFSRPGYKFLGWSTTPNGSVEYEDDTEYTTNVNLELYACWVSATPILIQYDHTTINHVLPSEYIEAVLNEPNEIIAALKSPVSHIETITDTHTYNRVDKLSYEFDGWTNISAIGEFEDETSSQTTFTPTEFKDDSIIRADAHSIESTYYYNEVKLYSNEQNPPASTWIYTQSSTKSDTPEGARTYMVPAGNPFPIEESHISAWFYNPQCTGESLEPGEIIDPITDNLSLYAQWARNQCKFVPGNNKGCNLRYSYVDENGTTQSGYFTETIIITHETLFTLTATLLDNYSMPVHWSARNSEGELPEGLTWTYQTSPKKNMRARVSCSATYDPAPITILFNKNGGSGGTSQISVKPGYKLPDITPPTKRSTEENRTFVGYFEENTAPYQNRIYDINGYPQMYEYNPYHETTILYARWTDQAVYNITYTTDPDDPSTQPTSGTFPPNGKQVENMGYLIEKNEGKLAKEGYLFERWRDANHNYYRFRSRYVGNSNLVLYPVFETEGITIKLSANINYACKLTGDTRTGVQGESHTIKVEPYENCTFVRWELRQNNSWIPVSTSATYTFTLTGDTEYRAILLDSDIFYWTGYADDDDNYIKKGMLINNLKATYWNEFVQHIYSYYAARNVQLSSPVPTVKAGANITADIFNKARQLLVGLNATHLPDIVTKGKRIKASYFHNGGDATSGDNLQAALNSLRSQ